MAFEIISSKQKCCKRTPPPKCIDTLRDNPESDAAYAESQAQIREMQARERGWASYSGGSYSEDWGDDYDYDEEHDDVDTWYGGDDDADMYWEFDYHE